MVAESADFKKAVEDSRNLKSKPTDDDLLSLYAHYKVATGSDFASAEKPGMFDLKGKAKYNAWKDLVESKGLSHTDAQKQYVQKVESMKSTYGF